MGLLDRFRKPRKADLRLDAGVDAPSLDEILSMARDGDRNGALVAATAKLENVRRRWGESSPAFAAASFEHGRVLLVVGLTERALESLRRAASIEPVAPDDEKARLTYLMNLGESLAFSGRLEEAAAVAEQSLRAREGFYGKAHTGYAYGLESLAEVALALGRYDDALPAAREALSIYTANGHAGRLPSVRAAILLAEAGMGGVGGAAALVLGPDEAVGALEALTQRSLPIAAAVQLEAVRALASLVSDADRVLRAWVAVQARARTTHDHVARAHALERIAAVADARGDRELAIDAELGLALCDDDAGQREQATIRYEQAGRLARALGSPALLCKTLRNAGLHLVKTAPEQGLALLTEATGLADVPADENARARLALGIQLQHRGELGVARQHLAAGLAIIDGADRDAICARGHLRAIEEAGSCGCGAPSAELHAQIERMIRARLPKALVASVDFSDGLASVRVTRPIDDREARLVADTVDLAIAELRARLANA